MPLFCIIESTRRRRTSGGRSPATTAAERRHSNRSSPAGLEHTKKEVSNGYLLFCIIESTRRDSNPRPSPWQGDTPPLSHSCTTYLQNHILKSSLPFHQPTRPSWISPRPISNSQLRTLLHFHLCPIYLVVFKGSYFFRMGYLILRGASRLDAFSVYPCQTWLPGHELSSSTGTPAVRPSRSSRTKDSSSQISSACAG